MHLMFVSGLNIETELIILQYLDISGVKMVSCVFIL